MRMPKARPALAPPDMPPDAASADEVADAAAEETPAATVPMIEDAVAEGDPDVSMRSEDCAWLALACEEVTSAVRLLCLAVEDGVAFVDSSSSDELGRVRTAGATRVLVWGTPPPTALLGSSSPMVTMTTL